MLAKCICTNCAGHLEFEEENAGESIPCPHCGFETTLELPGSKRRDPELAAWLRKQALRRRLVWVAGPIVVFGGAGYALYRWGVPWVEDVLPWADTTTKAVLALLLLCLMLPFALVWVVFPVLVFFQLRRLTEVFGEMAEGLRQRGNARAAQEDESDAAEKAEEDQPL
jgi:hypothetical protein